MQPRPLQPYRSFGASVQLLQELKGGQFIHGDDGVLKNLEGLLSLLGDLNLQVTRRAAEKLTATVEMLRRTSMDAIMSKSQAQSVAVAVKALRPTLEAELGGVMVYEITPKRFESRKLVENVSCLLAPGVFERLSWIARHDLDEAGKCIAFGRATAAAFHLLRATEAVLRDFYCHHVKRKRCTLLWGPMVTALGNRRLFQKNDEYKTLLNNLNNIRASFRNPTQHPEKVYNIEEAQDLWGLSAEAITRMARDLPGSVADDDLPF